MWDNSDFLGVLMADLAPQDHLELLWEGHIWGPQPDFVGALINAGGSCTHVCTTKEAITLYRQELVLHSMRTEGEDLNTLIFPVTLHDPKNDDIILCRIGMTGMHHAIVTYLKMAFEPHLIPEVLVAFWLETTECGTRTWHTTWGEAPPASS